MASASNLLNLFFPREAKRNQPLLSSLLRDWQHLSVATHTWQQDEAAGFALAKELKRVQLRLAYH